MRRIGWFATALAAALFAQGNDPPWSGMRAKNPAGVEFGLRLVGPAAHRDRELIQVVLRMPGQVQGPPEWQVVGYLLDPPASCGTVAKPCTLSGTWVENGDFSGLVGGPETRPIALNRYFPILAPGRYRTAALARKMTIERSDSSTISRYEEPPRYAVSDTVEFEITASSAEWVRSTIATSVAVLRGDPRSPEENEAQDRAAHQLALLDTAASREAALELQPKAEGTLMAGLRNSQEPAQTCDQMQARVAAPGQSVSSNYLYALAEICARAHLRPVPAVPGGRPVAVAILSAVPPKAVTAAAPNPAMEAWFKEHRAYTEQVWGQATARLAASLASKQPEAKWTAFATLLQRVAQVRADRLVQPDPAWIHAVSVEFVRSYAAIEPARKQYLLDMFTPVAAPSDVLPLLENVLDSWKPGEYYEAIHSALRALNRIDPARSWARMRAELTRPETWLDTLQLEMLPASAVPPMDDALIEALAASQRPPGWNPQLRMAALARYGTASALPRMKAIYESQKGCQPALLAYFVRVEPAYADRVFRAQPWDMHAPPPLCAVQDFLRIPPLAMSAGLEEYLAAYLMHSDVYVKTTAAKALGRYGSAAALPKLWDTLRYFQEWWKGKGAELAQNGQSMALEVELRNAIARGRGWLANPEDLRKIQSLCSSDWCRGETQQDLRAWDQPLRIELREGQSRVVQYFGLEDVAAVEAKLAQFPRGTQFVMSAQGKDADEVRRFAAARGMSVTVE